jgi:hypothetical protein
MAAMGVAFLAFGLLTTYFIRTSARPLVEGNIWGVSEPVRTSSAAFKLTLDSGRAVAIHCRYDGPGLREGDRARVRYVEYNQKLLELTMLTGSYTGWHFEESSGELSGELFGLIGLVCGFAGWRTLAKAHPRG